MECAVLTYGVVCICRLGKRERFSRIKVFPTFVFRTSYSEHFLVNSIFWFAEPIVCFGEYCRAVGDDCGTCDKGICHRAKSVLVTHAIPRVGIIRCDLEREYCASKLKESQQ